MNVKNLDFAEFEKEVIFHKSIVENNEFGGYQIVCKRQIVHTLYSAVLSDTMMTLT